MDFGYSNEDVAFARRLSAWLDMAVPAGWQQRYPVGSAQWYELQREWDRTLYRGGWAGAFWPAEHGGLGLSTSQRITYAALMASSGAPEGLGKVGKRLVAPLLINFADERQQSTHLLRILRGEELWCQGFSEPEAGSDLAAVKTRAERVGDHFVVNGQKVWTSYAKQADWCFLLVRTDPTAPKHEGLSFLLVPMDTPGIDVRPIKQITGSGTFNEVFFDNVRVPADNLVGQLNEGWRMAVSVLAHERGFEMAFGLLTAVQNRLSALLTELGRARGHRATAGAAEVGRLQAQYLAAQISAVRLLAGEAEGGEPDEKTSIVRMQTAELAASVASRALLAVGAGPLVGAEVAHSFVTDWLGARGNRIAGGTSEIQRNIIARRVLALR